MMVVAAMAGIFVDVSRTVQECRYLVLAAAQIQEPQIIVVRSSTTHRCCRGISRSSMSVVKYLQPDLSTVVGHPVARTEIDIMMLSRTPGYLLVEVRLTS